MDEDPVLTARLAFYNHVSRMYNSGLSVLIASISGYLAFLSLLITLFSNSKKDTNLIPLLEALKPIFITIGVPLVLLIMYFYVRSINLGRRTQRIEDDLNLREYINSLPSLYNFDKINTRPLGQSDKWTPTEIISTIILGLFLLCTVSYVIWFWII